MLTRHVALALAIAAGIALAMASPFVLAQADGENIVAAPDYGSGAAAGPLSDRNFNTPESDGRPGVYFFSVASQALRKGDYAHAVDMYKLAAFWAYAPAAYNLAVMYFKGQGVPVDRPLGAAWMVVAAQQGNPRYALARDQMVTVLTHAEFAETDRLFGQLQPKYGEQVTMRRAKARWAFAKSQETGSRVGGAVGELNVRVLVGPAMGGQREFAATGWGYLSGGALGGSGAYRQFQQSANPYSGQFLQQRKGTATVGALHEIDRKGGNQNKTEPPASAASTGSDP